MSAGLDPTRIRAFTFDCYGTLIDWETGLLAALPSGLVAGAPSRRAVLQAYAASEAHHEATHPGGRYPEILGRVFDDLAARFASAPLADAAAARDRFRHSVGDWPAFEETPAALRELAGIAPLFVLSNVDEESFARSRPKLGAAIAGVWTAEAIGAYKPDPRCFEHAKARLAARGIPAGAVVHVAESQFHDVVPARAAGLATVWVDRGGDASGGPRPGADPDLRVTSLWGLVEALRG